MSDREWVGSLGQSGLSGVRAAQRDASLIARPRHDGVGGHRPGAWGPRFHVKVEHPQKGGSWSGCGKAFLLADDEPAEDVSAAMRCALRGCKERWPS